MTFNVLFLGTPHFSVPCLNALLSMPGITVTGIITQPDRPAGRGGMIQSSPVKEVAKARNIPIFQPTSLRKELPSILQALTELGPLDLAVVVAFGQILPKGFLDYPRCGCLNVHASLLPRWRGAAPIQRTIMAGDNETGVCLMQMDEGLDTGAVFSRATIPITDKDTGGTLHDALSTLGASLLRRDLVRIIENEIPAIAQESAGVTYAAKITSDDAIIDWHRPAPEIARQIRALAPHPGAFTWWNGKRLKLFSAYDIQADTTTAQPGTILECQADRLIINCKPGKIAVDVVQLEGKKRMQVSELARGVPIVAGDYLEVR